MSIRKLALFVDSVLLVDYLQHNVDVRKVKGKVPNTPENLRLVQMLNKARARFYQRALQAYAAGWNVPKEFLGKEQIIIDIHKN